MAIQTRSSLLSRTGLGGAALSGVALAVPLLYALYAAITGGVTLSSNDDITSLFTTGIIITSVASVLALIATGLGLPGAMAAPRRGLATTGTAAGLLVVSALLLFAVLLPRAGAMQNLNDHVAPFAKTVRDTCRSGLNAVTADLTTARDHAKAFATNDVAFAGYMLNDALALNTDQKNLALGIAKLNAVDAPDKYQQLKKDCLASMGGQLLFLNSAAAPNAIALPAPYNALAPKVSAIQLLQLGAQVASGKSPVGQLPAGTIQPIMAGALTQIVDAINNSESGKKLKAEGDALTQDIKDTLNNNLAPFKSGIVVQ